MKCRTVFYVWAIIASVLSSAGVCARELQLESQYSQFEGSPVDLQAQIGKRPLYLKFWASWCLDCRKQMPDLQAMYNKYKGAVGIYAVNLNINETPQTLARIKNKYHLTIPIVLDHNGSIAANFNFVGTPFHVLINRQGKVVYATYKADEKLHKKLDQLAHKNLMTSVSRSVVSPVNEAEKHLPQGVAIRYFSASWCASYWANIEPQMAKNCVHANKLVRNLYRLSKQSASAINWQAYVTYLWVTPKEVSNYQKKYHIRYPLRRDKANQKARAYHVSQYPTLLVFKNGKEIERITQFAKQKHWQKKLIDELNL